MSVPGARLFCGAGLHPSTPENTYTRPDGQKSCRPCRAASRRASRAAARPPLPVLRPPEWMDDALCAQADPDAWFPESGEWPKVRAAKLICAACPVRAECLDYALASGERFGVWGGLSEDERRAELRRRRELAGAA